MWGNKVTYLEVKRSWVLGLSPNNERDPQNEQKQQPSHCCEPWVSSHQMAGPLGQYQAQDGQQENCEGQVGGEQMQLQKLNVSRPWLTSHPQTAHIKKSHYISKIPKAHPPTSPCQLQNTTKETAHCSPNSKAHP